LKKTPNFLPNFEKFVDSLNKGFVVKYKTDLCIYIQWWSGYKEYTNEWGGKDEKMKR
jgi:hypothetical protein